MELNVPTCTWSANFHVCALVFPFCDFLNCKKQRGTVHKAVIEEAIFTLACNIVMIQRQTRLNDCSDYLAVQQLTVHLHTGKSMWLTAHESEPSAFQKNRLNRLQKWSQPSGRVRIFSVEFLVFVGAHSIPVLLLVGWFIGLWVGMIVHCQGKKWLFSLEKLLCKTVVVKWV